MSRETETGFRIRYEKDHAIHIFTFYFYICNTNYATVMYNCIMVVMTTRKTFRDIQCNAI